MRRNRSGPVRAKKPSRRVKSRAKSDHPKLKSVLFRPDRLKYVRKLVRSEACVFCEAYKLGSKVESLLLGEKGEAMAVLNKYPYNSGHILILPKRHVGEFQELTRQELGDLQILLQIAQRALKEAYDPSGFNVGLNLGSAAGAGIPEHLHWHLIPRWSGDTNFFPLIADTKVVIETLESTFDRLVPYFR